MCMDVWDFTRIHYTRYRKRDGESGVCVCEVRWQTNKKKVCVCVYLVEGRLSEKDIKQEQKKTETANSSAGRV